MHRIFSIGSYLHAPDLFLAAKNKPSKNSTPLRLPRISGGSYFVPSLSSETSAPWAKLQRQLDRNGMIEAQYRRCSLEAATVFSHSCNCAIFGVTIPRSILIDPRGQVTDSWRVV